MRFLLLNTLLLIPLLFSNLFAQNDSIKPDYRNRTNIHEYDPSLMPLNYNNRSTGVWTELNPNVPRVDYLSIDFVGTDTGWAVGANGAIIKTSDAGNKWKTINSNNTNVLLNVNSFNGSVVIATGFNGTILRSMDRGESFENIYSGVSVNLWSVKMLNDTLGWICGLNSTLLKTTDGGLNWQLINTGFTGFDYWSLNFLNETIGFIACGNGNILKTINGGESWQLINVGENIQLYTITVFDSLNFLAAGQKNGTLGRIAYTSNGGNSFGYSNAGYLVESISFANDTLGYAVGSEHVLYRTINKGRNWEFINFSEVGEFCIKFLNDSIAYQTGRGLTINKTSDKGYTWSKAILNDNFYDVHFINETTGFALSGAFYKTTNGGLSWERNFNAPGGYDIIFLDSLIGFIGGSQALFKTIDGGNSWYNTNGTTGIIRKIFFYNHSIGWATGGRTIFKTIDGGENWFIQITLPSDNFSSLYFIDSLNGWATSRYIWQTTDGGVNWIQRSDIPAFMSTDIYFIGQNGFIINDNQKLYKSTDNGNNWFVQINSPGLIRNFGWLSNKHGFIMGYSIVYETNDSGVTWNIANEVTNIGLQKFSAPNNQLGYSVGTRGLIYRYTDTSIVPIELTLFEGKYSNNKVFLNWQTASELNNHGFEIQKSSDCISWEEIGFVQGMGTTSEIFNYSYIDENIKDEINYYRLKQIDLNGSFNYSQSINVTTTIEGFKLFQNFPNPFNSSTIINYQVPVRSFINISLYDIKGEKISELATDVKEKGSYKVVLGNIKLPSGIYFARLQTSTGYSAIIKLTLIK